MGKLTVSQAKYIGPKTRRVEKATKKILRIVCKSASDGKDVAGVISSVYGVDVDKFNSVAGTVGLGLLSAWVPFVENWQTFRAHFSNSDDADNCMKAINAAISQYGAGSDYEDPTTFVDDEPGSSGGGYIGGNEGASGNKAKDWTTYIIIGAALAVIIVLLWKRKKK